MTQNAGARPDRVIAFGLCLILLTIFYLTHSPAVGYDGVQYLVYAKNLLKTGQFTFDGANPSCGRAPGYPLFLTAVLWMTGGIALLYPLQLLLLFAACWCVYAILAPHMQQRWALGLLVALTALWPLHTLAMDVKSESLFMALTAASLLLLSRGIERGNKWNLVFAGLGFGLSAYVRPVNIFASIFLAAYFLWRGHIKWKRAALLVVVSWLPLLPWTIRNALEFGRFVPVAAHIGSFYYMTDPDVFWPVLLHSAGYSHTTSIHREIVGSDLELDVDANKRYLERGLANIRRDPLGFVLRCSMKTVFVWSYLPGTKELYFDKPWLFASGVVIQWTFLVCAFAGWRILRNKSPAAAGATLGYALYTIAALLPFYAESRFLLPVYIWLFGLTWYWLYERRSLLLRLLNSLPSVRSLTR